MREQMKKRRGKSINTETVKYLIFAAVFTAVLIMFSYCLIQYRTVSRESISFINRFEGTYQFMMAKESDTAREVEEDICVSARLTASALRMNGDPLKPGKYWNGWIIRKKDNRIVFPNDYSEQVTLTASDLPDDYSTNVIDGFEVSCARIDGDNYYIELNPAFEEDKVIERGVNYQKALENYASATGYDYMNLVSREDGDYAITAATGRFKGFRKSSELGLNDFLSTLGSTGPGDDETSAASAKLMHIKRRNYIVFGTKAFDVNDKPSDAYDAAVMLVPLQDIVLRALAFTLVMVVLLLILCIPMAVWLISIFRRLSSGYFTDEQLSCYSYEIIRRKVIIIIAVCAITAYTGAFFTMSLDCIFVQTSRASSTLNEFFKRIDDDAERTAVQWESNQTRYIENAKRLAALIDSYRDLQNEEWLREASGIIDADYIMIFDENGDELISDSQYKRISLNNRKNPDMADFSRLLYGVESISHAGVEDEVTGLTRDYHGICLKYITDEDTYGAMLIAVDPREQNPVSFRNSGRVASSMSPENGFIIGINPKSGAVTTGSSKNLTGNKLKKSEIDDSFLGFIQIDRKPYYAVSSAHGDKYYYYCIDEKNMMEFVLLFSICYALVVLLFLVIMSKQLLSKSPYKSDESEIINAYTRKKLDRLSAFIQQVTEKNNSLLRVNDDRRNVKITKDYYYRNVTPEREALSAFEMLLFIFTLSTGIIVLARNMSAVSGQTVIEYLFTGKWTHGFNLFSFSAIFFLFCILFVLLAFLKAISAVLDTVLAKRARTISSLIINVLFYAVLIIFVFISLGCLGVNAKALLASAGLFGLAVSMSFRDIISDILAGVMIITGKTFEVGDYIEIKDASSGTVKRMGLRKTELISDNGRTFSIRNSHINKVTNHSRKAEKKDADKKEKT